MIDKIYLCAISNIESGTCLEDCKFCTQSVKYKADIVRYKRKTIEEIREAGIEREILLAAITSFIDFGPLDYTGSLG